MEDPLSCVEYTISRGSKTASKLSMGVWGSPKGKQVTVIMNP